MQNPENWINTELDDLHVKSRPTNLIINFLPRDTTDNELLKIFSTFGSIRSVKIVRDGFGLCVGYGFVNFESTNGAKMAEILLNGLQLRNKRLKVAFALPRSRDTAKCNLYIRFLPAKVNEMLLETLFQDYGGIWSVKILRNKTSSLMYPQHNVAYVRFRQPADAERARIALDGYRFPGSNDPISVQTARNLRREEETRWSRQMMKTQVMGFKFSQAPDSDSECALDMPWSPLRASEAPIRPEGFVFSD
ncbi:hypothetical protein KR200_003301 [Drosophila serrata]|nr:hypothetical protein KR200_003301 [Drosophila serrata]